MGEPFIRITGPTRLDVGGVVDPNRLTALLVFTADPGTESHEKLRLLPAVGDRPAHV